MGWKYRNDAERKAAMKEYQAKYRALRKSGKWVRKTQIHSPRIAAKYKTEPVPVEQVTPQSEPLVVPPKFVRTVLTPEERKAREKAKNHRYWHDHYSAVRQARRRAAMTPEQRERCERLAAARDARKPEGVVREIIDRLAAENNRTPDEMTLLCVERGAIDFLLKAIAPRMEKPNYNRDRLMRTAIQATRLYLDREAAVLKWKTNVGRPSKRKAAAEVIDVV